MMKILRVGMACFTASTLAGCSLVRVKRVEPDNMCTRGVRYWMSAPYLLVKKAVEIRRTDGLYEFDTAGNPVRVSSTDAGGERETVAGGAEEGAARSGAGGGGAGGGAGAAKPKTPQSPAEPKKDDTDPIAITWLPDYCQEYAVNQWNFLASGKLAMKFTNGSQLESINSELNSTEVINKFLDTVGGIVTAASKAAAPAAAPKLAEELERPRAARPRYRCTEIKSLRPGVYPLLWYGEKLADQVSTFKDCKEQPHLSLAALEDEGRWATSIVCDKPATAVAPTPRRRAR